MSDDRSPILKHSFWSQLAKWGAALGFALAAGLVLGFGMTTFPRPDPSVWIDRELALSMHGYPPVIAAGQVLGAIEAVAAGIGIGLAGAVLVRAHPLWASLLGGIVAAACTSAAIVLLQWQRGRWPVGTVNGRTLFFAGALAILVCSAAWLTAVAATVCRRRAA
jgi:hypothetical protein